MRDKLIGVVPPITRGLQKLVLTMKGERILPQMLYVQGRCLILYIFPVLCQFSIQDHARLWS